MTNFEGLFRLLVKVATRFSRKSHFKQTLMPVSLLSFLWISLWYPWVSLTVRDLFLVQEQDTCVALKLLETCKIIKICKLLVQIFREGHKFGPSSNYNLTLLSNVKKRVEDGPNFCGLLRISELDKAKLFRQEKLKMSD